MAAKINENVILDRRQVDLLAVQIAGVHVRHQLQPADVVGLLLFLSAHGRIIGLGTSELPLHSRNNLHRIERLRNIIVRPHGQSRDLVHVLDLRRQHDDRKIPVLPDLAAKLKAVDIRQHYIKDRQ